VERVPEINLAILLGTFGSAFTATLADYYKEVRPLLNKAMSDSMDTYINEVTFLLPFRMNGEAWIES